MAATDQSQELDQLVKTAISKIQGGEVSLDAVLKTISPTPKIETERPETLPLARKITPDQRAALDRVAKVFAKVVPAERRALEPTEITQLIEERLTLDEIKKLAEARIEDIRATVCNHLDVLADQNGGGTGPVGFDKNGHYVLPGREPDKKTGKAWSRELRTSSPTLTAEALKALEEDGEIDHADYLAMTSQVRVVDENKLMIAIRHKPELVRAIAKATTPGSRTAALYLRNA